MDYDGPDDMIEWAMKKQHAPRTELEMEQALLDIEQSAQSAMNEIAEWITHVVTNPSGNIIEDLDAAVNQARAEGIEEGKKVVERWLEFMMLSNDDLAYAAVYGLYQSHYKNGAVK